MGLFRKINVARMAVMRKLASHIGGAATGMAAPIDSTNVKRILISRPNGRLGNLLLITPLLQEVAARFPNARVDLFVKGGLAPVLFSNYDNVDTIIQLPKKPFKQLFRYLMAWIKIKKHQYDLVINVVNYSSSGRLSTRLASADYKLFGDADEAAMAQYPGHKHIARHIVYYLRNTLEGLGMPEDGRPVPPLNLRLTPFEKAQGRETLAGLADKSKRTISLFTYATGTKCYPQSWWKPFYERLKREYPNHNIIEVLPVENISQIGFAAPSFYSKDIRRIGALIANTDVFIGADSGMMHLASAVQTPTVGLFSVTDPGTFGPYGNNSVAVDTNAASQDELVAAINAILAASGQPQPKAPKSA